MSISQISSTVMTALLCCHNTLIAAPIPFQAPHVSCMAVSFCRLAMATDIASPGCMMSTGTAVYIFPVRSSDRHSWSKFTQAYRVKYLEKNLQSNDNSSVVDQDRKAVLRMSEKHDSEGGMDDNNLKERVESVAPVAEGMVASSREDRVSVVEECYGERVINVAATGMRPRRSHSLAKSSLIPMRTRFALYLGITLPQALVCSLLFGGFRRLFLAMNPQRRR